VIEFCNWFSNLVFKRSLNEFVIDLQNDASVSYLLSDRFYLEIIVVNNEQYAKASSNVWSFIFSFPTNIKAYAAIGFSKNGNMVGSTAIVGWMPSSGAGGMKMYSLDGKSTIEVIPDKGELYIMNASIVAAGNSLVYMIFQLKTTQPSTKLLFAIGPNGVFPNYPDYALSKHSSHISLVIDYSKG